MYKIKTIWTLPNHYIASEVTPKVVGEVESDLTCTLKKPFLSFFFQNFVQMWRKLIATYLPGFGEIFIKFKKTSFKFSKEFHHILNWIFVWGFFF
jgi:hypothetical protein